MKLQERAKRLKADIPAVFLSLKDKDTPITAKLLAGITVSYALSPVDFIPDFIPILGYLDDVIILSALISRTVQVRTRLKRRRLVALRRAVLDRRQPACVRFNANHLRLHPFQV